MSWMQDVGMDKPELEKAIHTPLGAVSPLWWAFAGAATAGVAYWWMTRWAKPFNFEAAGTSAPASAPEPALEEAAATYDLAPDAIEDVVDTPASDEPAEEMQAQNEGTLEAFADDLTQLVGIGPKLALALADRGVSRFSQIAEWGEDDLAYFDRELNLKGRAVREGWIDQAKALAGEPTPVLPD
jgi:predicted flap endonuclease-1-like 5' DNA nuclease